MRFDEFSAKVRADFPEVTDAQMEQFRAMEPLYLDWNSKINVISRKDMDSFYDHHVLHSLAIARYLQGRGVGFLPEEPHTVLDLGTGGGFPGIPLAVMYPGWRFTLCDSIGKKILVASEVARALGLSNVETVNARAETLPGTFDFVVSRAVTSLDNFFPWVKDRYTGHIFYLKGGDINEEISSLLQRTGMDPSSIHTWKIDSFLADDYFSEKFVIDIEKSYLCNPNLRKYKNKR